MGGMRLNIKTTQCCAACEFWDDVGRTAMSPTIGRNMWEVNKKEQRLCLRKRILKTALGRCQEYKCKLKVL